MAHDEARAALKAAQSGADPAATAQALLGVVHADDDADWLQARCIELVSSGDPNLRRLAITCLGHLARVHGVASPEVVSLLNELTRDPEMGGTAEDALSDIATFVGPTTK